MPTFKDKKSSDFDNGQAHMRLVQEQMKIKLYLYILLFKDFYFCINKII